jgi:hypothetical protein
MVDIKNPLSFWPDECTFVLVFDGGIDEDGDEFEYCIEYHKDADEFVFVRLYEYDVAPTGFTKEQEEYLKATICEMMK